MCSCTCDKLIYPLLRALMCRRSITLYQMNNLFMLYWSRNLISFLKAPMSSFFYYYFCCISFRYPLVLTIVFNLGDLVLRYLPLINCLRITSRRGLMVATLARFLFIPAFYYMAKYGDQGWMIMLTFILGLTNGYLAVCALMAAPKGYKVSWFLIYAILCYLTINMDPKIVNSMIITFRI